MLKLFPIMLIPLWLLHLPWPKRQIGLDQCVAGYSVCAGVLVAVPVGTSGGCARVYYVIQRLALAGQQRKFVFGVGFGRSGSLQLASGVAQRATDWGLAGGARQFE